MHRFYVADAENLSASLSLDGAEAHHAADVLRVRPREEVLALDGAGHEYRCEVVRVSRGHVALRLLERRASAPAPFRLTLFQALTKQKSMDLIVQKATELGAHRLVPVCCDRSVVKLTAREADDKVVRWQALAIEAMKQSGAQWLPQIDRPIPLLEAVGRCKDFDLCFVASLRPETRHPRARFAAYRAEHGYGPNRLAVWVGPEGDFTPVELDAICCSGAVPMTLGPLVLRSETAALYCLSVLSYELRA